MNKAWKWFVPGWLWSLPLTLVGVLYALVICRARDWRFERGVLSCVAGDFLVYDSNGGRLETRIWGRPGAQTIGQLQIYAGQEERDSVELRVHETTHVVQAYLFELGFAVGGLAAMLLTGNATVGVLGGFVGAGVWAVTYGACFLVPFAAQGFTDWYSAYRKNPFERHAYRVGDKGKGLGE